MGKVVVDMSISLDGFIAGENDSSEQPLGEGAAILHDWLFSGNQASHPDKGVPVFVVTHKRPQSVPQGTIPFTFVTDGVTSAVEKAKEVAGNKEIGIAGANVSKQCLDAGLVDELFLHIVPVILGKGKRLFKVLTPLEIIEVINAPDVT